MLAKGEAKGEMRRLGKGARAKRLTAAVDAASVGGDGGDEDYAAPALGFHAFDYAFDEEE